MDRLEAFCLLALLIVAAGCDGMGESKGEGPGKKWGREGGEEDPENARIPVRAEPARKRSMGQTLEASAPLEARRVVEVHPEVSGRVREIHFDAGDRVEAGALLAALEDPELARSKVDAELALATKRQEVEKARVRLSEIESDILQTKIDLAELARKEEMYGVQLERDRATFADKERLWQKQLIQKSDYDAARTALDKTENDLRTTGFERQRKELALSDLSTTEKEKAGIELAMAELAVKVEETNLAQIEENLVRMRIVAPAAGIVASSGVEIGKWATKETAIVVLAITTPMIVRLRFPEREIPLLLSGQKVAIASPTLSRSAPPIEGKVDQVSRIVDASSGTVEVRVEVLDPDPELRPGMLVRCRIEVLHRADAIVVPKRSVLHEKGESHLFRVVDGKAVRTAVELGFAEEDEIEIRGGVAEGELVVTVGNKTIKDGTPVTVLAEE